MILGWTYLDILGEELGGSILSEWEWEANFTAVLALTKMTIANGWETNWVRRRGWNEALEFLNEGNGGSIDIGAHTSSNRDIMGSCKDSWEEGNSREED